MQTQDLYIGIERGQRMHREVVIIGAGIVGLALARDLSLKDIRVTVYDAKKKVSDNASKASGILSVSGLETIGIPYREAVVNRLDGAVLHAGKETLHVKAKDTKALVVDRGTLADSCLKEAEKAGARVVLGRRLEKDEIREIAKDKSNVLVGADGAASTVANAFSFPQIREHIL